MNQTLLDKWRYYMKDVKSPDSFIDMGFYYMIAAALQRRVWTGTKSPEVRPLFPNMYIILVGPPAVGKGQVIQQVAKILKHHKQDADKTPTEVPQALKQSMYGVYRTQPVEDNKDEKLLIPVAADATTYEQLLRAMTRSLRLIKYQTTNDNGDTADAIYLHRSLCFCLEEISSLFKKNADNITKFLLAAFDCGDYDYETKHQGIDRVRKLCLNLFGGTTSTFLEESFDERLLSDGFTSRTIFIFESVPRHIRFNFTDVNRDQLEARTEIIGHIHKLAQLYGHVKFSKEETPEAFEILRRYFEEVLPKQRANNNTKLDSYYGRKDIHAVKLAMAVHFSKSFDLELTPEDCIEALRILNVLEHRMHLALDFGKNPLYKPMKNVEAYLRRLKLPQTFNQLLIEFSGEIREQELHEILRVLIASEKVVLDTGGGVPKYKFNRGIVANAGVEHHLGS